MVVENFQAIHDAPGAGGLRLGRQGRQRLAGGPRGLELRPFPQRAPRLLQGRAQVFEHFLQHRRLIAHHLAEGFFLLEMPVAPRV